jgi:CBS domain-containing protein
MVGDAVEPTGSKKADESLELEFFMIVEGILPAAANDSSPSATMLRLSPPRALLRDLDGDIVIVRDCDRRLAGVITKTEIVRQISHCQGAACAAAASAVMTQAVVYCRPSNLLRDVWLIMKERRPKNIPILDRDSRPIGVLNARDALEALLEEVEYEEGLLQEYVMCVGYH